LRQKRRVANHVLNRSSLSAHGPAAVITSVERYEIG
jgi:hypothetical protein